MEVKCLKDFHEFLGFESKMTEGGDCMMLKDAVYVEVRCMVSSAAGRYQKSNRDKGGGMGVSLGRCGSSIPRFYVPIRIRIILFLFFIFLFF